MRVGFPGGPRLEYYDRNPISRIQGWTLDNQTPHGTTTAFTYTVPTGKRAFLGIAQVHFNRATAPTTPGLIRVDIRRGSYLILCLYGRPSAVDAREYGAVGFGIALDAAEVLAGTTADGSTGGTVDYSVLSNLTEFDA